MEKREVKIKSMCSLTEDEVRDRYEKTPSAPIAEESPGKMKEYQDDGDRDKMMDQTRRLLFDKPHSDGLRLRKSDISAGDIAHYDSDGDSDDDSDDDRTVLPPADHDYQRPDKLDLMVGFLRLFNFVSCCTSVFAVTLSLLFSVSEPSRDLSSPMDLTTIYTIFSPLTNQTIPSEKSLEFREDDDLLFFIKILASLIILVFLIVTAVIVIIDSVATVTFRWKEYGELAFRHTDATSILFLISKSRWKLRLLTCLTVASACSLQTTQIILHYYGRSLEKQRSESTGLLLPREVPSLAIHALIWYISLMGLGLLSWMIGALLHLIPYRLRAVPWLDNSLTPGHVDDKGDVWHSSQEIWSGILSTQELVSTSSSPEKKKEKRKGVRKSYQQFTILGYVLESLKKLLYFSSYVMAVSMNLRAVLMMELSIESFEFWTCVISTVCTSLISLYLVILICMQCFRLPPRQTPFLSKVYVPFTLSSGIRLLLDLRRDVTGQRFFAYTYLLLILAFFFLELLSLLTKQWRLRHPIDWWAWKFIKLNFYSCDGAYKKCVRLFDTLGSFFGLVGLLLGLFSMMCDQYDLEFEFEGDLKTFADGVTDFTSKVTDVADELKRIIKAIDYNISCEQIYSALTTGSVAAFVLSIVPGASGVANFGARGSYYTVKAGGALSRLAGILKVSAKNLWKVTNVIYKLGKFSAKSFKTFTIGGSSLTLLRLLPFLPPVFIGVHILFSSFWPKRVLFFHASQRRRFIDGLYSQWTGLIILLILALAINTALVDEVANAFNEAMPLLNVHVQKKLGWRLSIAASTFAICSATSYIIAYLILRAKTNKDHENLTNEEKEWREFVDSKKKCTYYNAFGPKIEWKNQIKYKKERIGGWNWVLPILLCLIACGFGVVANLYPKIDMYREPKGPFGRTLDKILTKVAVYEDDMRRVREYGEKDCLPFATFQDVLKENMDSRANILMNPIYHFFNQTEEIMKPLKEIVSRTRRQLISDIGDEIFGEEALQNIKDFNKLDLRYLGFLLLIPRALNLLVLVFGSLSMCYATCQMSIIPAIEPRKIVNFFGSVCVFSLVYVLGTQMAVFNILSDFGVPFYRISVRLGLGFMYDVAADAIMVSIWIGMRNQYFFAIPQRKVTVSYSVPGVSDGGPNPPNRIL